MEIKSSQKVTAFGLSFLQIVEQIVAIPALAWNPINLKADLERDLEALLSDQPGGISVTLKHGRRSPLNAVAGFAGIEAQEAFTPDHASSIGSITKTMVATVLLMLVEDNQFQLDQLLSTWFPNYPNADKITLRMLLNHTSGIPEYNTQAYTQDLVADPTQIWTADSLLAYSLNIPFSFEPGQDQEYSNTNFLLLGMILEQATGHTLAQLLRDQIFAPLDMDQSYLRGFEAPTEPHAQGYIFDPKNELGQGQLINTHQLIHGSCTFADGGVVSTSDDMVRFMSALMNGELLSQSMLAEMIKPTSQNPVYGLGITLNDDSLPDESSIGHDGGFFWGIANLVYFPDEDAYLAIQYNMFAIGPEGLLPISQTFSQAIVLARITSAQLKAGTPDFPL